jgi:hypothetical protein
VSTRLRNNDATLWTFDGHSGWARRRGWRWCCGPRRSWPRWPRHPRRDRPAGRSVDGLATSINASAGTISGTARGINGTAGTILATARSINDGVAQINANLDTTLGLADALKTDTGNILAGARAADRSLDCIENGFLTGGGSVPGPVPC